jgi:hypothetical protein
VSLPPSPDLNHRRPRTPGSRTGVCAPLLLPSIPPCSAASSSDRPPTFKPGTATTEGAYLRKTIAAIVLTCTALALAFVSFIVSSSTTPAMPRLTSGGTEAWDHTAVEAFPSNLRTLAPALAVAAPPIASDITLVLEAAIDVDGDVKVWRRAVRLHLRADARDATTATFLKRVAAGGCGGELLRADERVHGRLTCGGAQWPPPEKRDCSGPAGLLHRSCRGRPLPRGVVGWRTRAESTAPEFFIQMADTAGSGAPLIGDDGTLFADVVDATSLTVLDELRTLPTRATSAGAILDPQPRMTVTLN